MDELYFIDKQGDSSLLSSASEDSLDFIPVPQNNKKYNKKKKKSKNQKQVEQQKEEEPNWIKDYIEHAPELFEKVQLTSLSDVVTDSEDDSKPQPSSSKAVDQKYIESLLDKSVENTWTTSSSDFSGDEWADMEDQMQSMAIKDTTNPNSKSQRKKKKKAEMRDKQIQKQDDMMDRIQRAMDFSKIWNSGNPKKSKLLEFFNQENSRIHDFISQSNQESFILTPMPGPIRQIVFDMATCYHLKTKTRGRSKDKMAIVFKTKATVIPHNWTQFGSVATEKITPKVISQCHRHPFWAKYTPKRVKKAYLGPPDQRTAPKEGDVVGANAQSIGSENIGHKMLLAMGWTPGQGLGDGTGLKEPIPVIVRSKRGGLGAE